MSGQQVNSLNIYINLNQQHLHLFPPLTTGTNLLEQCNHMQGCARHREQLYNTMSARANRNKSHEKLSVWRVTEVDSAGVWSSFHMSLQI